MATRQEIREISRWVSLVGAAFGGILVLLVTADVAIRLSTGRRATGLVELSEALLIGMIFLGAAYAEKTGAHVRLRLVTSTAKGRTARALRIASFSLMLPFIAWLSYGTGVLAFNSWVTGEARLMAGRGTWPLWPTRLLITFGLLILLLEVSLQLFRQVREGPAGTERDELASPTAPGPGTSV